MITAIGTNVLLDVLVPNEKFYAAAVRLLEDSATAGSLVICDLVFDALLIANATLFFMATISELSS